MRRCPDCRQPYARLMPKVWPSPAAETSPEFRVASGGSAREVAAHPPQELAAVADQLGHLALGLDGGAGIAAMAEGVGIPLGGAAAVSAAVHPASVPSLHGW